jgi:hypothetical protein
MYDSDRLADDNTPRT